MRTYPRRVENYTTPFLVSAGVTLFMALFVLAATAGMIWVITITAGLELAFQLRTRRA